MSASDGLLLAYLGAATEKGLKGGQAKMKLKILKRRFVNLNHTKVSRLVYILSTRVQKGGGDKIRSYCR